MAPQILTFIIVLAVIFIIFKIFNLSIKIFFKLLINALIGAALLFVFNFVFAGLLNLTFCTDSGKSPIVAPRRRLLYFW